MSNQSQTRELFNNQAFIDLLKFMIERWTEFSAEITNLESRAVNRLSASDRKALLDEIFNELVYKERDND